MPVKLHRGNPPGKSPPGGHSYAYENYVNDLILNANSKKQVEDALAQIRSALITGAITVK